MDRVVVFAGVESAPREIQGSVRLDMVARGDHSAASLLADDVRCCVIDVESATRLLTRSASHGPFPRCPILVRTRLDVRAALHVMRCAAVFVNADLSIVGVDDLASDVRHVLDAGLVQSAAMRLIAAGSEASPSAHAILTAVAVLGRRRCDVPHLARVCRLAPRTLEWRLERTARTTPRRLLGLSLALHTSWRLEILGWTLKRAARVAGFSDSDALSEYVRRQTGSRPQRLRDALGFDGLLDQWSSQLGSSGRALQAVGD